jgi:cyclophilin family peptidyl-prolyl cis-trans isomerase
MTIKTPLMLLGFALIASCSPKNGDTKKIATPETTPEKQPEKVEQPTKTTDSNRPQLKITTDYGVMIAELYNETPKHRDNFLKLASEGYYNDLVFHRVIRNFMIQGGDPDSRGATPDRQLGSGGPGYQVDAEFNPKFIHKKGALAAARTGGPMNPEKKSSGSQFYIVQGNITPGAQLKQMEMQKNAQKLTPEPFAYTEEQIKAYETIGGTPHLDMDYTVFGEVISGLDVIDKIGAVQTGRADRPVQDVKMKIEVIKK